MASGSCLYERDRYMLGDMWLPAVVPPSSHVCSRLAYCCSQYLLTPRHKSPLVTLVCREGELSWVFAALGCKVIVCCLMPGRCVGDPVIPMIPMSQSSPHQIISSCIAWLRKRKATLYPFLCFFLCPSRAGTQGFGNWQGSWTMVNDAKSSFTSKIPISPMWAASIRSTSRVGGPALQPCATSLIIRFLFRERMDLHDACVKLKAHSACSLLPPSLTKFLLLRRKN